MKTKHIFSLAVVTLLFGGIFKSNAQATQATNAITSGSYLGTSNNFDVVFKRQAVAAGLISTTTTSFGLNSNVLSNSVSIGTNAGKYSTAGTGNNVFLGFNSGMGSSTASSSGTSNTCLGYSSGAGTPGNTTGSYNTLVGSSTASDGSYNTCVGQSSGGRTTGDNNTFLGSLTGLRTLGSNNVFVGYQAGYGTVDHTYNNTLIIENTSSVNPLIWGDFAADQLKFNGKVGIGGNSTTGFGSYPTLAGGVDVSAYQLFVKGGILTEEVRVSLANTWADYVFNKNYSLKPLAEVEKYINDYGHLPNVPSAAQVKEEGIELGNMAKIQQEKIEELTLYIIQQNKINEKQAKEIEELKKLVNEVIAKK